MLHVAIVFGGASWYRFFGAGERFARAAEQGRIWQDLATFGIAVILAVWAAYALSGAGILRRLPLLSLALLLITAVYLVRGAVVFAVLVFLRGTVTPLLMWSSLVCLVIGIVHAIGLAKAWPTL